MRKELHKNVKKALTLILSGALIITGVSVPQQIRFVQADVPAAFAAEENFGTLAQYKTQAISTYAISAKYESEGTATLTFLTDAEDASPDRITVNDETGVIAAPTTTGLVDNGVLKGFGIFQDENAYTLSEIELTVNGYTFSVENKTSVTAGNKKNVALALTSEEMTSTDGFGAKLVEVAAEEPETAPTYQLVAPYTTAPTEPSFAIERTTAVPGENDAALRKSAVSVLYGGDSDGNMILADGTKVQLEAVVAHTKDAIEEAAETQGAALGLALYNGNKLVGEPVALNGITEKTKVIPINLKLTAAEIKAAGITPVAAASENEKVSLTLKWVKLVEGEEPEALRATTGASEDATLSNSFEIIKRSVVATAVDEEDLAEGENTFVYDGTKAVKNVTIAKIATLGPQMSEEGAVPNTGVVSEDRDKVAVVRDTGEITGADAEKKNAGTYTATVVPAKLADVAPASDVAVCYQLVNNAGTAVTSVEGVPVVITKKAYPLPSAEEFKSIAAGLFEIATDEVTYDGEAKQAAVTVLADASKTSSAAELTDLKYKKLASENGAEQGDFLTGMTDAGWYAVYAKTGDVFLNYAPALAANNNGYVFVGEKQVQKGKEAVPVEVKKTIPDAIGNLNVTLGLSSEYKAGGKYDLTGATIVKTADADTLADTADKFSYANDVLTVPVTKLPTDGQSLTVTLTKTGTNYDVVATVTVTFTEDEVVDLTVEAPDADYTGKNYANVVVKDGATVLEDGVELVYSDNNGSSWVATPKNAGTYVVKATYNKAASGGSKAKTGVKTMKFTIKPLAVTVTPKDITYDAKHITTAFGSLIYEYTYSPALADGEDFASGSGPVFSHEISSNCDGRHDGTFNIKITNPDDVAVEDGSHNDTTSNYAFTFAVGTLTVTGNGNGSGNGSSSNTSSSGYDYVIPSTSPEASASASPSASPEVSASASPSATPAASAAPAASAQPAASSAPSASSAPAVSGAPVASAAPAASASPAATKKPEATKAPKTTKNACKSVKAAKKNYTIAKKGKTVKVVFNLTNTTKNKKTTDTIKVTPSKKAVIKVTKTDITAKKVTVTVKGLKKGNSKLTIKVGKKTASTKVTVKKK